MRKQKTAAAQTRQALEKAVRMLAKRCPRLVSACYWAGTSCIAIEELQHRESFDLDFHTQKALVDVRPILAEIQTAFQGGLEVVQAPDEFGSGFQGVLTLPGRERVTLEVLSNFQDVPDGDLVPSRTAPAIRRVSLYRYLADKIQCVAERLEARDLVDILAVLRQRPEMEAAAKRLLARQDAVLMAERLMAWSDEEIEKDLKAYPEASPADAKAARNDLLKWLKMEAAEG